MILLPPHLYKQYRTYCAGNGVQDDSDLGSYLNVEAEKVLNGLISALIKTSNLQPSV